MNDAVERIAASRERLRAAMLPPANPSADPSAAARSGGWWRRLSDMPTVAAVLESVQAWWSHHPLRPVSQVAAQATCAVVGPVAQRRPWTLVFIAAGFGAALFWSRPWRWAFRSALLAGLVPQVASRVMASLPIESWMTLVAAALSSSHASSGHPEGSTEAAAT